MYRFIMTLTAVLTMSCAAFAGHLEISRFAGDWVVDYDRTLEAGKKSPKYDAERMPAMIKSMMEKMKIRMTENEMIYLRGKKELKIPFTVKSSDEKTLTVSVTQGNEQVTIVFTLIDGACMNFKSSGSDDMDFFIWTKAPEEQKQ